MNAFLLSLFLSVLNAFELPSNAVAPPAIVKESAQSVSTRCKQTCKIYIDFKANTVYVLDTMDYARDRDGRGNMLFAFSMYVLIKYAKANTENMPADELAFLRQIAGEATIRLLRNFNPAEISRSNS